MAIVREQVVTKTETASANMSLTVAAPKNGSALLLLGAVDELAGIRAVTQAGATWNKLQDSAGNEAEEDQGTVLRANIWAAFNVVDAGTSLEIDFSGGLTNRAVIFVEYSGDVFLQPNPLDQLSTDSGIAPVFDSGPVDSGTAGTTREDDELWVGLAATSDRARSFTNAQDGFTLVSELVFGIAVSVTLLEKIVTAKAAPRMRVDMTGLLFAASWVGIVAAMRGDLQVPATAVSAPTTSQAMAIRDDVSSEAIANLSSQFRSGV